MNPADRNKPLRQYLREQGVAEGVLNHPSTLILFGAIGILERVLTSELALAAKDAADAKGLPQKQSAYDRAAAATNALSKPRRKLKKSAKARKARATKGKSRVTNHGW